MKFTINEDIFSISLKKQKTDYNNGVIYSDRYTISFSSL